MIYYRVSPNLKEWTYCNGLMEANAYTWNKLYDMYVNKLDENAWTSLFCSENPNIIINFLHICMSENTDLVYYKIYANIIHKHAKNNVIIDYVLTNFEKITPRYYNIFNINCKHILTFVYSL